MIKISLTAAMLLLCSLPATAHEETDAARAKHQENAITLSDRQIEAGKFEVGKAQAGLLAKRITVPGSIVPSGDQIARVAVRLLGTVTELRKRLGDTVLAGEVVAVIESREVADAKSEYLAARLLFDLQQTLFSRSQRLFEAKFLGENDFLRAAVRQLKRLYAPLLRRTIERPIPVIVGSTILFALAATLFLRLGQEFIPTLVEKNIAMHALRIPSTSLAQAQAMQLDVERAISAMPEVAFVFSKTGTAEIASDPMPPNASDTFIILKPESRWPDPKLSKDALLEKIANGVRELPGNNYEFTQPIQMRFNKLLAGVRGDIAVKVFGDDFESLLRSANQVAEILRATKGATDVKVEQASGLSVLEIRVDKVAIARRGLNLASVQEVIGTAIGGRHAGLLLEGDRYFDIVVRLPDSLRNDIELLKSLPVSLPSQGNTLSFTIPLGELVSFDFSEGPNQISRENGKRRVVITANVRERDIASVVKDARPKIEADVKLPAGYWISWGGQFENLAAARQRLLIVVPICFVLIFLLLTNALGSARDALLVFSAVPLALTGGVLALWLRGIPFSVSAAVGFIALSGIAVLNGLVILTFIKQLIAQGGEKSTAIFEGGITRLRPVAMTALVASLGFVPMALATGTGAEVQRPIATVVIGGLISATLLTLFVLPALFARYGGDRH